MLVALVLLATAWGRDRAPVLDERPTAAALDRLQEVLALRVHDGALDPAALRPALLVQIQARPGTDPAWFQTRGIEALQASLGPGELRLCAACLAPRAALGEAGLVWQAGPLGLDELRELDRLARGEGRPARSAIWLEEQAAGVSLRVVDLDTGELRFARNVDPLLAEHRRSQQVYTMAEELERRARGQGLTQLFVDAAFLPGQHFSLDWTDQWGTTNANLTGLCISAFDPLLGLGAAHYRRVPLVNTLLGGKLLVSVPTGVVKALGDNPDDGLDPLLTAVGVVRVPFGRSNYGALLTVSTNAELGLGISLMNVSLLPFLP